MQKENKWKKSTLCAQ